MLLWSESVYHRQHRQRVQRDIPSDGSLDHKGNDQTCTQDVLLQNMQIWTQDHGSKHLTLFMIITFSSAHSAVRRFHKHDHS